MLEIIIGLFFPKFPNFKNFGLLKSYGELKNGAPWKNSLFPQNFLTGSQILLLDAPRPKDLPRSTQNPKIGHDSQII